MHCMQRVDTTSNRETCLSLCATPYLRYCLLLTTCFIDLSLFLLRCHHVLLQCSTKDHHQWLQVLESSLFLHLWSWWSESMDHHGRSLSYSFTPLSSSPPSLPLPSPFSDAERHQGSPSSWQDPYRLWKGIHNGWGQHNHLSMLLKCINMRYYWCMLVGDEVWGLQGVGLRGSS